MNPKSRTCIWVWGFGVIGGLMAALLARKEIRELLRERSGKTLGYLDRQGKKLRETTAGIVEKGKEVVSHRRCSVDDTTEGHILASRNG